MHRLTLLETGNSVGSRGGGASRRDLFPLLASVMALAYVPANLFGTVGRGAALLAAACVATLTALSSLPREKKGMILLIVCLVFAGAAATVSSNVASPNGIRYASDFAGADAGAKIAACVTALPTAGGICDARGFQGVQPVAASLTIGSATKPVQLLLGQADFQFGSGATLSICPNCSLVGISNNAAVGTIIEYVGTTAVTDFLTFQEAGLGTNASLGPVGHFTVKTNSNVTNAIRLAGGVSRSLFEEINITGTPSVGMYGLSTGADAEIYANVFNEVVFFGVVHALWLQISNSTAFRGFIEQNTFINCTFRNNSAPTPEATVLLQGQAGVRNITQIVFINPDSSFTNGDPIGGPYTGTNYDLQQTVNTTFIGGEIDYGHIGINIAANSCGVYAYGTDFFGGDQPHVVDNSAGNCPVEIRTTAEGGIGQTPYLKGPLNVGASGWGQQGVINIPNSKPIVAKNAAGNNDLFLIESDSSNNTDLRTHGAGTCVRVMDGILVHLNAAFCDDGSGTLGRNGPISWTAGGALRTALHTVAFSSTPTFDASLGNAQKITLAEDVTFSRLLNAVAGQELNFIVCQDATGGHRFAWPANFLRAPAINTAANDCKGAAFIYDGTKAVHLE